MLELLSFSVKHGIDSVLYILYDDARHRDLIDTTVTCIKIVVTKVDDST